MTESFSKFISCGVAAILMCSASEASDWRSRSLTGQVVDIISPSSLSVKVVKQGSYPKSGLVTVEFDNIAFPPEINKDHACVLNFWDWLKKPAEFDTTGIAKNSDIYCKQLKQDLYKEKVSLYLTEPPKSDAINTAIVFLDGQNYNIKMISDGMVRVDYARTKDLAYQSAENDAKSTRAGLWDRRFHFEEE